MDAAHEDIVDNVARDSLRLDLGGGTVFQLTNGAGDVRVTHTSAAPTASVERVASAATDVEAGRLLHPLEVECSDGVVRIGSGPGTARATLVVALPEIDVLQVEGDRVCIDGVGADIRCVAQSGLEVSHLGGLLDARVASGDAVVTDVQGRIVVHLATGSLRVVACSGHLEVECLQGDVDVEGFAGEVRLRVPNGEARVRGASGTAEVR